jgi:hypothetical protein
MVTKISVENAIGIGNIIVLHTSPAAVTTAHPSPHLTVPPVPPSLNNTDPAAEVPHFIEYPYRSPALPTSVTVLVFAADTQLE